jgi:hypothetical protein
MTPSVVGADATGVHDAVHHPSISPCIAAPFLNERKYGGEWGAFVKSAETLTELKFIGL